MNYPKIIHQTWKNNNVPDIWKESQKSWILNHPEWKYYLWTDEDNRNLIKNKFPWFLHYYDNYKYNIQRVDAVRYFILYTYGGCYVDLDIANIKNIEIIINSNKYKNKDVLLVETKNGITTTYTNAIMISKKGALFWKKIFNTLIKKHKNKWYNFGKHLTVMNSTGPNMITNIAKRNLDSIGIIEPKYLHPCTICDKKPCTKLDSFVKILQGSSWVGIDGKIYTYVYCKRYLILILILILVGIIVLIR